MKEPGVRILLVEDEAGHAGLVRRAFESAAPQVILTVASTLQQARTCLDRFPPDLLITDLLLPDGPGTDLLPGNGGERTLPAVVISGKRLNITPAKDNAAIRMELHNSGAPASMWSVRKSATIHAVAAPRGASTNGHTTRVLRSISAVT